ncbi:MAG: hypothetical protein NTY50_10580 [Methylobacter sp.]|nr:hypothetical protein [Methylobacter sp.]
MSSEFNIYSSIAHGNELRRLLNSNHISDSEVYSVLKEKGIYVGNNEKEVTVPLLSATLLTPDEFLKLIENNFNRESRPKVKPLLSLELAGKNLDWISPLKESLLTDDLHMLLKKNGNETFVAKPTIVVEGKKITIFYSIKREDFSRDFLQRELIFNGEITIEQQGNSLKLDRSSTHSSKGIEAVNKKINDRITKILSDSKLVTDTKPQQITFGSFTNDERVRFFKRLTAGFPKCLSPGTVNDIEIRLDENAPPLPDDPQISWMKQAVRRLKIDGERLNDIFLISDEQYYRYYYILRIDITFPFKEGANSGECHISFSFSHSERSKKNIASSELIFDPVKTTYKNTANSDAKKMVTTAINKAVRSLIEEKYELLLSERNE